MAKKKTTQQQIDAVVTSVKGLDTMMNRTQKQEKELKITISDLTEKDNQRAWRERVQDCKHENIVANITHETKPTEPNGMKSANLADRDCRYRPYDMKYYEERLRHYYSSDLFSISVKCEGCGLILNVKKDSKVGKQLLKCQAKANKIGKKWLLNNA